MEGNRDFCCQWDKTLSKSHGYPKAARPNYFKYSFFNRYIYNSLTASVMSSTSNNSFKASLLIYLRS